MKVISIEKVEQVVDGGRPDTSRLFHQVLRHQTKACEVLCLY